MVHAATLNSERRALFGLLTAQTTRLLGGEQRVLEDSKANEGTRNLVGTREPETRSM